MTASLFSFGRRFSIGTVRAVLWTALLGLTVAILATPVRLIYQYKAIQSSAIFVNLPLFGLVYLAWTGLLLLLSATTSEKNRWEGLAVVVVFALVFLGFWALIASDRQADGLLNIATVKYVTEGGTLSRDKNVGYLDFPGLHILAASLSQATRLGIFSAVAAFLLLQAVVLAALLHSIFTKTLGSPHLAIFAVLITLQGNWTQSLFAFFWPRYMGLIFLVMFLVLLNRRVRLIQGNLPDTLVLSVLLIGCAMTYFVTSMVIFFVALGVLSVHSLVQARMGLLKATNNSVLDHTRGNSQNSVGWSTVVLCFSVPVAWELLYASAFFGDIVSFFPRFVEAFSLGGLLGTVFRLGGANLGEEVPQWAVAVRWFWLILIYGMGGGLVVMQLLRLRRLNATERMEIGGLLGIAAIGVFGLILTPGGYEVQRVLMYSPLFLVPITLRVLGRGTGRVRGYFLAGFSGLFLALSLPTFLAHNGRISTDAFYPYEYASGEFARSIYGSGHGMKIFLYGDAALPLIYNGVRAADYYGVWDVRSEDDFWQSAFGLVAGFQTVGAKGILVLSMRGKGGYEHILRIKPTDRNWAELEKRAMVADRVYDNGYVQIYEATGKRLSSQRIPTM